MYIYNNIWYITVSFALKLLYAPSRRIMHVRTIEQAKKLLYFDIIAQWYFV